MELFLCVLALAAAALAKENQHSEDLLYKKNGEFTYRMFGEVVKRNPGKSVVQSAFSVLTPLSQLALATEGESHKELLQAVGLPDDEAIITAFSSVNCKLRVITGVNLKIANRIYVMAGKLLNQNTAATFRETFGTDMKDVDFTQSSLAAKEINGWVEEHTNHRIKDLVDPKSLNSDTRSVLVNAIYFKGNWMEKFDKNATIERDFHVDSKTTIKIPFMHKRNNYTFYESEELDAKFLEIPFEGKETSFLIALPNKIDGLNKLDTALTPEVLNSAMEKMFTTEVDVRIPKFKIETVTNLKDVLSNLGVKKIFDREYASITKLIEGNGETIYITGAIQKAFIEVNEDGAEASAANVFNGLKSVQDAPQPKNFHACHPFAFYLKQDKNILFNGHFIPLN